MERVPLSSCVQDFVILLLVHTACCTVSLNPSIGTPVASQNESIVHSLSNASITIVPSVKDDEPEQDLPTSPALDDQWPLPGNRSVTSGSEPVSTAGASAIAPIRSESQPITSLATPDGAVTQPVAPSPATLATHPLLQCDKSSDGIVFCTSISADFTLSINVSAPDSVLSSCSQLRLSFYDDDYFRPLSTSAIQFPHFPAETYCLRLQCGCMGDVCRYLPTPAPHHYGCQTRPLPGFSITEWNVSVLSMPLGDVGELGGPALQLELVQRGQVRFPWLKLYHNGTGGGNWTGLRVAAHQQLRLDAGCRLQHDASIEVWVFPDTWFCEESRSALCFKYNDFVPPLTRGASTAPVRFKPAPRAPMEAIVAGVTAVLVVALVLIVVIRLRIRYTRHLRGYDNEVAQVVNAGKNEITIDAGSHSSRTAVDTTLLDLSPPGGQWRVLLVHSAVTAAETATVERLVAALRSRGVSAIDLIALGYPSADAPVPAADDRVLVLSCPSAAAALAGARSTPRQRRFAAAVRQLAGGAAGTRYGRVLVAQLGEQAPLLAPLTPGVRYTLPQHTPQLVLAVLGGDASAPPTAAAS